MSSIRAVKPVKLFTGVLVVKDDQLKERLEERLISDFGPSDHRLSLIPTDGTIQRTFLSFDRLIETGNLPKIMKISKSIEEEFSATLEVGYLDNRRVAVGTGDGEDMIQFRDGGIHVFPWTHPNYLADTSREFFLSMRKSYRAQLRSMCLLRR